MTGDRSIVNVGWSPTSLEPLDQPPVSHFVHSPFNLFHDNSRFGRVLTFYSFINFNYEGSEIVSYEAPEPTMGIHRVVLVLFRQPTGLPQAVNAPEWRHNFNIREFSRRYNLGSPVAAIYYNCLRETGVGGRRA